MSHVMCCVHLDTCHIHVDTWYIHIDTCHIHKKKQMLPVPAVTRVCNMYPSTAVCNVYPSTATLLLRYYCVTTELPLRYYFFTTALLRISLLLSEMKCAIAPTM